MFNYFIKKWYRKKICRYPHNEYPHGYEWRYETNIYSADRVQENNYPYLTLHVDAHISCQQITFLHLYKIYFKHNGG